MTVTILTANPVNGERPYLTKKIRLENGEWQKTAYDNAAFFSVDTAEPANIFDFSELLTFLEGMPHSCIIRAEPVEGIDLTNVRRRKDDHNDGQPVAFREHAQGRPWLMLDFDKEPCPAFADTQEKRLAYLVSLLPEWFHKVTYHYQWSSSAGLDGWQTLSAHLFFWLSEPWTDSVLCRRMREEITPGGMRGWNVDESPCRTVQINYTARPIFEGVADPLEGQRSGLVWGSRDVVDLPPAVIPKPPQRMGRPPTPSQRFEQLLQQIGPRYHMPICRAVAHFVSVNGAGCDVFYLKSRLINAINAGIPGSNPKEIYLRDAYLDATIRGAIRKFC